MVNNCSIPLIEQVDTLCDLMDRRVDYSGQEHCLFFKEEQQWLGVSWNEFNDLLNEMAAYLYHAGCRPGEHVGIMAGTSLLWDICHYAILKLGGVVVGLDPHDTAENVAYIIHQADICGVLVDSEMLQDKIAPHAATLSFVLRAEYSQLSEGLSVNGIEAPVQQNIPIPKTSGDNPATIIFTSGTTGASKGIVYTHAQVIVACRAILGAYKEVTSGAHLPCWLPLSNLFQRMLNFAGIAVDAKLFYLSNPMEIVQQLPEINPDVIIGVPRFYEKVYEGISHNIESLPWPLKKSFALGLELNQKEKKSPLDWVLASLINKVLMQQIRQRVFGQRLKFVVSGSAPMPLWLLKWYKGFGILVLEAYGISENIIPISCNTEKEYKFGSVGRVLKPNMVRIAEDGELQVKGPGVFNGYLNANNKDQKTADGYLKTGDEAFIDENGYIFLLGRKSDFFKTSTGKRVAPVSIEARLSQIAELEHVLVIGEGRKVPILFVTITADKISLTGMSKVSTEIENIRMQIKDTVEKLMPVGLQPAAVILTNDHFSIETGELTPNLKLRRKVVIKKYESQIEQAYALIAQDKLDRSYVFPLTETEGGIVAL
jgi:long-chain acyl-CoA synthetase